MDKTIKESILIDMKSSFDILSNLKFLTKKELVKYKSLTPKKQEDYILGRLAVKELLRRKFGGLLSDYEVLSKTNGRPYVTHTKGIYCNISHSKKYIAVIIGNHPNCGIDIEENIPKSKAFEKYILTNVEKNILIKNFQTNRLPLIAWCAKEVAIKSDCRVNQITKYDIQSCEENELIIRRGIHLFRVFVIINSDFIYSYG